MRRYKGRRREITYRRVGMNEELYLERKRRRQMMRIAVIAAAAVMITVTLLGGWFFIRDEVPAGLGSVRETQPGTGEKESTSGAGSAGNVASNAVNADKVESAENAGSTEDADASEGVDGGMTGETSGEDDAFREAASGGFDYSEHPKVKGIYVTGPMAGNAAFEDLLTLVDDTELNAMVIDVKNDAGEITYRMEQETAQAMGACINYIRDMEGLLDRLKEHDVYTIARIVCFKDPYLAEYAPELALKTTDGQAVVDGHGVAWVNPYREEVWEYLVEVARKAGELGFDEIQFDYVRFPLGSEAEGAVYGVDTAVYTKQQAISDFLNYAVTALHAEGLAVTADVFGTIIGSETDVERVGQDYAELSTILDAICPMVYPSHYANGVFGLSVPDAYPYETVYGAMTDSVEVLAEILVRQQAVVRPWLQAFTATWVNGHISYGAEELRAQIQAVYDAGYEEWILWNASNRYTADGLLNE